MKLATNNTEKELIKYIENNDIENAQKLFSDFEFNYGFYVQILQSNSKSGNLEIVKLIIDNNLVEDPSIDNNYALIMACSYGHLDIVKLLINDNRVVMLDIFDNENKAIQLAYQYKYFDIVDLLWSDERVKKTLKHDNIKLYDTLISNDIKNKVEVF